MMPPRHSVPRRVRVLTGATIRALFASAILSMVAIAGCAAPGQNTLRKPAPPPAIVQWDHTASHSFAAKDPDLGVSHRYESRLGFADVYVYSLGMDWQPGLSDPKFPEALAATVTEFAVLARRRGYTDVLISDPDVVEVAGTTFALIRYAYQSNGYPVESRLYLTAQSGQLIKYRVTCPDTKPDRADQAAITLINATLGRLPSHADAPGLAI